MLKVSRQPSGEPEIFHSIQGEGVNAGTPAVFLRLALCNLACTWCDTKYTWDWDSYDIKGEVVSLSEEEVERRILSFDRPHLVITGGEPLLQQEELAPLATSLHRRGFYCEVETNGTLPPSPEMVEGVSQWNVSPKTTSSGNRRDRREVPQALNAFRELDNAYFKFVIVGPEDIEEVSLLADTYRIPPHRVLLMPEGVTAQVLQERGRWVAEACRERGFRFSTRLHILLWGDRRGR
jgi:organic radical activating enzyme